MYYFLLLVFIAVVGITEAAKQTECERHKAEMLRSTAPMRWNITCDKNGDYAPLQCTVAKPRWCTCYRKDGQVLSQPSRKTTTCACVIAKDNKELNSAPACEIPECERTGKYQAKQCCKETRKCHCVNEETGEKLTNPTSGEVSCS